MRKDAGIPEKAKRILHFFLFSFLLIAIRVWYLAVLKHEEHQALARKPQIRVVVEEPTRGTIRDRFNTPLAVNKIEYTVSLSYEPIRRLPLSVWKKEEKGKKIKIPYRKNYVAELISFLQQELHLDPLALEDLIYGKAALFPNSPIVLKEGIPEHTYYRLRAREKDWPGLLLQLRPKRHYPKGMVAGTVLGYMGMMQESHLEAITQELILLETYLKERTFGLPAPLPKGYTNSAAVKERYQELKERSYSLRSLVGKSGIEAKFDDQLRGVPGKRKMEIDSKGRVLRNLPDSSPPLPGRRILLTLSAELQEYAEQLLALHESARHARFPSAGKNHHLVYSPWIKGGAIVAILPHTGEIVALASHPRYAPEDFVEKNRDKINKWLETPAYIGEIWDGIRPLERTLLSRTEEQFLSLDLYLQTVLSLKSPLHSAFNAIKTVKEALYFLQEMDYLWALSLEKKIHPLIDSLFPASKGHTPTFYKTSPEEIAAILERVPSSTPLLAPLALIPHNDDKILFLDLLRLLVPHHLFTETLLQEPLEESLATYRSHTQMCAFAKRKVQSHVRKIFHDTDFQTWRKNYFTFYLKAKRKEEKEENRPQRSYLDYLEAQEESLFTRFFRENQWKYLLSFIASAEETKALHTYLSSLKEGSAIDYLKTLRNFEELSRPLLGKYYFPFGGGKEPEESALARHFYPFPGFGYARSFAFQENVPLGSIFKLVTGYEAAKQQYVKDSTLNPLIINDQSPSYEEKISSTTILGYTSSGIPITRFYKGGRLPRGHPHIGTVNLPEAIVRSSNLYFALLAIDRIQHPSDLLTTSYKLGLGHKTGLDLPGEVKGHLPSDIWYNPTALYSFAFGQHSLTVTPLQTALLFSTFANGGKNIKPQIIHTIANLEPREEKEALFRQSHFSYQDLFAKIGIYFPLFPLPEDQEALPYLWKNSPLVQDEIYLPENLRDFLFTGLHDVLNSPKGTARPERIRFLKENAAARHAYEEISPSLIGKTSTAEILYRPSLERDFPPLVTKHIWFAGIAFEEPQNYDYPELIVVVFLRYGDHGKEAAPLAAQMVKKWREIKSQFAILSTQN